MPESLDRPPLLTDRRALLLLLLLVLVCFRPLVLSPTSVLYSPWSDLWAQHVPAKRFLVRSWHETGELPLWCPLQFSGSPFVHDPQVAIFYPLHWPLLLMPENAVGVTLSWLIVLHVLLAAWLTYLYCRTHNLCAIGALVAAVGYAFGGRWTSHLLAGGHYVTIGLAWLPLVLLCLEMAIRSRNFLPHRPEKGGLFWATLAGMVYALMILSTHPQWTFYSGIFIALWTLVTVVEPTRRSLLRWLGYGLWTVAIAVGLAAVQLLPTLEAAGQSTRGIEGVAPAPIGHSLQVWALLIGPSPVEFPHSLKWEDRGGLSLIWLLAAIAAPVLVRGRVRRQAAVCLLLLLLGGGGMVLLSSLPGFSLFRQPPRIWLVAAFPLAYLAGVTTQAVFVTGAPESTRRRCFWIWIVVSVLAVLAISVSALWLRSQNRALAWHLYWLTLPLVLAASLWLIRRKVLSQRWMVLWCAVLLLDLWLLSWSFVDVRNESEIYEPSGSVKVLQAQKDRGRTWEITSWPDGDRWLGSPLGHGAPLALVHGVEAVRGYNPLDKYRYRLYLQFIADEDGDFRALESPYAFPVMARLPIDEISRPLLDLLNVRYLLAPEGYVPPGNGWTPIHRDPNPSAYNVYLGGRQPLPPFITYRNEQAMERAFIVHAAKPTPAFDDVLEALKSTDFHKTVLIEGLSEETTRSSAGARNSDTTIIRRYSPNHVEIEVRISAPGYLVLCDPWYPGWTCSIDGRPAPIHRANFVFRAVKLPAGEHIVKFDFVPRSYVRGRLVSTIVLLICLLFVVWAALPRSAGGSPARVS